MKLELTVEEAKKLFTFGGVLPRELANAFKCELTGNTNVKLKPLDQYDVSNLINEMHYSKSQDRWVYIQDMNSNYILNVLAKTLREDRLSKDTPEFKSLILNLAEKIKEGTY